MGGVTHDSRQGDRGRNESIKARTAGCCGIDVGGVWWFDDIYDGPHHFHRGERDHCPDHHG
jgi:hypothetical protein